MWKNTAYGNLANVNKHTNLAILITETLNIVKIS